uniref:Uncharacterized protein n=1 Tax=Anguilla anguilla TaxID=7936 RepID=A0A0E9WJK8_ANGAN
MVMKINSEKTSKTRNPCCDCIFLTGCPICKFVIVL